MSDPIRKKNFPEWLKWVFVLIAAYLAISGVLMLRHQRSESTAPATQSSIMTSEYKTELSETERI